MRRPRCGSEDAPPATPRDGASSGESRRGEEERSADDGRSKQKRERRQRSAEAPEARLCGEQKKVYRIDPTGTVLVRGSAGSGKTLVAMARARFLDAYAHGGLFDDCKAKTGFFVYNTSLRD